MLSREISGKDAVLNRLNSQINELTQLLALERTNSQDKEDSLANLQASLSAAQAEKSRLEQLLAQGKAADALAALDRMPPNSYPSVAQELRGDVLVKLGRPDDARKAYIAAKAALGENAPQSVQMKIDDLAVAGKQGA